MPALPSYRNESFDLLANQLTGFYMRVTPVFNGLKKISATNSTKELTFNLCIFIPFNTKLRDSFDKFYK